MEDIHLEVFFNPLIRDAIFSQLQNKDVVNFRLVCREFNESAVKEINSRPPLFRLKVESESIDACYNFQHLNWIRLVEIICDQTWTPDRMNQFYNQIQPILQKIHGQTKCLIITHTNVEEGKVCFLWDKLWNSFEFPKLRFFELSATITGTSILLSEKPSVEYIYLQIGVDDKDHDSIVSMLASRFHLACQNMKDWQYAFGNPKYTKERRERVRRRLFF